MHRRLIWPIVGLLAFVAILVLVFGFPFRLHRGITVQSTTRMLDFSVPRGTTAHNVIAFLDEKGIEHSPYRNDLREIHAIRRNVCLVLLVECSIEINFIFDANGHVAKTSVSEEYTGL